MKFQFRMPAVEESRFAATAFDHWVGQQVSGYTLVAAEVVKGGTEAVLVFEADPDETMLLDTGMIATSLGIQTPVH